MYKIQRLICALAVCLLLPACISYQTPPVTEAPVVTTPDLKPKPLPCLFPRVATRLGQEESLTVIAIGSSSTLGAGASSSAATYPALLRAYLVATFPDLAIVVHNKGVNGETTAQTLARFESDVVALQANLVIWQVGTNDALRDIPFSEVAQVIESGLLRLKQHQMVAVIQSLPAIRPTLSA